MAADVIDIAKVSNDKDTLTGCLNVDRGARPTQNATFILRLNGAPEF